MNINRALSIQGWMSQTELEFLANVAKGSHLIIESGSYKGRSAAALAENTPGKVICVDPWQGIYYTDNYESMVFEANDELFNTFKANVAEYIANGKIEIFRGTLQQLPMFYGADLIFLDGDHHYLEVLKDIETAKSMLRPGGMLAGHDYTHTDWPGVKRAVDEVFGKINYIDSIWWTRL